MRADDHNLWFGPPYQSHVDVPLPHQLGSRKYQKPPGKGHLRFAKVLLLNRGRPMRVVASLYQLGQE